MKKKRTQLGARAYLKSIGFEFGKKPRQLDQRLLQMLSSDRQELLRNIWEGRNLGHLMSASLYSVPETRKQAALLFSQDRVRSAATLEWFDSIVSAVSPESAVEFGCGAGFLLGYLGTRHPGLHLQGVDEVNNLVAIASDLCGIDLITGNYLTEQPDGAYGIILCDFGFDNERFAPSEAPHSEAYVGGLGYCPGCSDDLKPQVEDYMRAWRRWAQTDASLAITGRIQGFGPLRAFVLAAESTDWVLSLNESRVLRVKSHGEVERFPALLFRTRSPTNVAPNLEEVATFYESP